MIDDDALLAAPLATYFRRFDYELDSATTPSEGLARLRATAYDAAILDVMLPEMDGFELCRTIRRESDIPIVMLTARGDVMDRIVGLEIGADDYVPKPFDPRELAARVKSVLRRTSSAGRVDVGDGRVRIGRCVLDVSAHRLTDENGAEVAMTPLEYDLLKALAEHPNRALSRERILNLNQQRDWDPFDRSVDLRIMRLRKKIEPDPEHPRFIRTVRNEGYIFVPDGA